MSCPEKLLTTLPSIAKLRKYSVIAKYPAKILHP